jgi:DNA-binding transcriptional regulator YiaG
MKGKTFKRMISNDLGLTQVGTAALFGVGERTVRDWVSDDYQVPGPTARLAVLLAALKETGQYNWAVEKMKGVK